MKWLRDKIPPTITKNNLNPFTNFFQRQEEEKQGNSETPITDEGIQNVLDAKISTKAKISISHKYVSSDFFLNLISDNYLNWLKDSQVRDKYILEKYLDEKKEIPVLLFEDFNTSGLKGDPNIHSATLDNGLRNDYHIFTWYLGAPVDKGSEKGGSVGVGRLTFAFTSLINTFFTFSVREDQSRLFLGISSLGKSKKDTSLDQMARFGLEKEIDGSKIVVPITEKIETDKVIEGFDLNRKSNEVGTSMIVPFPTESIKKENLIINIIDRYRYAILNDELELDVFGIKISKDTISQVVEKFYDKKKNSFIQYFKFINDLDINNEKNNFYTIDFSSETNPSKIKKDNFKEDEIERLVKDYNDEKIISIKVPILLTKKEDDPENRTEKKIKQETFFKIFLKKTTYGLGMDDVIRGPMPVSDLRSLEGQDTFGLILIDDDYAKTFYRLAESPNHRLFEKTEELMNNYDLFNHQLLLVKKGIAQIKDIILDKETEISIDATKDWFSFDGGEEDDAENKTKTASSEGDSSKRISSWIFENPKSYEIKKIFKENLVGIQIYSLDFNDQCTKQILKIEKILTSPIYKKTSSDVKNLNKQIAKLRDWLEGKNLNELYPVKIFVRCAEDIEGQSMKKVFDLHDKDLDFDFTNRLKHKIIEKKEGNILDVEKYFNEIILTLDGSNFKYEILFDAAINKKTNEGYDLVYESYLKRLA